MDSITRRRRRWKTKVSERRERMKEMLSFHRVGLCVEMGKTFTSTNCIESVMSLLG